MDLSSAPPDSNSGAPLQLCRCDSSRGDIFPDDILAMIYGFTESAQSASDGIPSQFEMIREESNPHFERKVSSHDSQDTISPGPHMLIGQLEAGSLLGKARGLQFVSSQMRTCYYSSIRVERDFPILEIWYNLKENHTVNPLNLHVNIRASLEREHEPVYFAYNFQTGYSTYLLSKADPPELSILSRGSLPRLHPFTVHLALLSHEITVRMRPMAQTLDRMLRIEKRLLERPLPANISANVLKSDLQELHGMHRLLVVCAHRTGRDLSNVESLLRDLDRLGKQVELHTEYFRIDHNLHERVRDGLLSIRDSCINIDRRLENRRRRIENMIALLYNLMQNQDSTTMRQDSAAMKTIATLTMLFLPATFVSGLFGTNFFALFPDPVNGSAFVVSDKWWILITCSLPLTLLVLSIWRFWPYVRRVHQELKIRRSKARFADIEKGQVQEEGY
ncbi:hypothetical protein MMC17_000906 [Xylographa soralifera]|nr:hypothetical protein [Xylographa soralifera]